MNGRDTMTKARAGLILDHPFFGSLAMRLELRRDYGIPTAATDGETLTYNPKWTAELELAQQKALLAKAVLHAGLGHVWRRGGRDEGLWQKACTMAVLPILEDAGLSLPVAPGSVSLAVPAEAKAAEEFYETLRARKGPGQPQPRKQRQSQPGGQGKGQGKGGQQGKGKQQGQGGAGGYQSPVAVQDALQQSPAEKKASQQEWKVAVVQAANAAKMMGRLPGELARMVKEITSPPMDWRRVLADFLQHASRNDYNWCRPNRRHLQRGIILPNLYSRDLGEVVIVIDTSGSIDEPALNSFAAAVSDILEAFDVTVRVVYCDAKVQGVEEHCRADLPLKFEPKGGGGTDFRPPFAWVEEQGLQPTALIYFTDLICRRHPPDPGYPVLWLVWGTHYREVRKPVFGKILPMEPARAPAQAG